MWRCRGLVRRALPLRLRRLIPGRLRQAQVAAPTVCGMLDHPTTPTLPRALVHFSGWGLEGNEPMARVDLTINDASIVEATLGDSRPDVAQALGRPHAADACGWTAWVDLAAWSQSDLRVVVMGFPRNGPPTHLGSRHFKLTGRTLTGSIDWPLEGEEISSDRLYVSGWACIGGRNPSRVEVTVDGRAVGRASLRIARSDLATSLPIGDSGPLAGFEYHGPLPKTTSRRVEVGVTVVGFDGESDRLASRTVHRVLPASSTESTTRAVALRKRTQAVTDQVRHRLHHRGLHLMVFTHSLRLGGGELYLSELLRHLAPRLSHCTVVSADDGPLRDVLEGWGTEVIVDGRVPCPGAEVYEGQIRELALFISGTDPDVVLLNTLGEWVAGDAAQRVGLPTIWSIHESFELDHWLDLTRGREAWDPYLKDRLITTLGAADRLVFEAEATSQMFARYADADHRSVVKYGVDVDAIAAYERDFDRAASRAKHGIRDEAVVLLSMGVVGERKATACLIDGFQKAAADHPNASLIIVGDHPSPYSYLLHRLMDASGLGDRLRLLPITPHIWEWYALSDILVSASDIESLPRSMLEAMAFGLPNSLH